MPAITLGQLTTADDSAGLGPRTIVLAQGLGLDRHTWGPFAQLLAKHHRVITFDAADATRFRFHPPGQRLYRPRRAFGMPVHPHTHCRTGGRAGAGVFSARLEYPAELAAAVNTFIASLP